MRFKSGISRLIGVAGLVVAALLVGCASNPPAQQPAAPPAAEQPAQAPAEVPAEAPASEGSAAELTRTKCTMCHTYDRVESAQKDEAGWAATVDRMVELGLVVTPEEKESILDHLTGQAQ